ncbi:MAG: phosphate acyltransferase [Flavobacteriaceae bacterium]
MIVEVPIAVAKAAIASGVAQEPIDNWQRYEAELVERLGGHQKILRMINERAKSEPKSVVFAEADQLDVIKAAQIIHEEKIGIPILLGNKETIQNLMDSIDFNESIMINELADAFGSQCVVVAIDAKKVDDRWLVHLVGGKVPTQIELKEWAREAEIRGAGEILFTSMDHDGTKNGFANVALAELTEMVNIPIIASGGAGNTQHFVDTFKKGKADAALAASVFHFGEIPIPELKQILKKENIPTRII